MMSHGEVLRVLNARNIMTMSHTTQLVHPCWVCANRGHAHVASGCHVAGCSCCTRMLMAVWP